MGDDPGTPGKFAEARVGINEKTRVRGWSMMFGSISGVSGAPAVPNGL